jgi:hypothetical protein
MLMTAQHGWEAAFVAVSGVLGLALEESVAAVGDAGALHAGELLVALRSPARAARARAIARVVSDVALAVDAARLA